MAEFQEVMKQMNRMCHDVKGKGRHCEQCDLSSKKNGVGKRCTDMMSEYSEKAEKIIMDWAAEHPEPQYPTWVEWQGKIFPASLRPICPLGFMIDHTSAKMCISEGVGCGSCVLRERQIPADIAEKLGIKLKEEK